MRSIEILRVGTHIDSRGVARTFSKADLAATTAAYDPALHEAPLVVGHPADDDPAYGWTQSLSLSAGRLSAAPHQVNPVFAEQVASGAYKKRSAAFYGPDDPRNPVPGVWYLRHIGFLGAQPPAIKGLAPVEFTDAEGFSVVVIEFNEGEEAPATAPVSPAPPVPGSPVGVAPLPAGGAPTLSHQHNPEEIAVNETEAAALRQENEKLAAKVSQLEAATAAAAQAARHAEHVAYAETLVEAAKIPAAAVPVVATLLDTAAPAAGEPVEFAEGDERMPLAKAFRNFLDGLTPAVEFGEVATKRRAAAPEDDVEYAEGSDPARVDLDRRIRAHAKEQGIGYAEAARAIVK